MFRFGDFELDARSGELRRRGEVVKLQPQPFRVLTTLVEREGELVTREELKRALWGDDTYVDFERGLNFCVNQVRAALGDSAESPTYVETLPRRGYRFIGGRTRVGAGSDPGPTPFRPSSDPHTWQVDPHTWQIFLGGVAFLATLTAGATFLAGRTARPAEGTAARTMVAVLPLDDLTGDPSLPWFADGLTDELIAQIGRVSPARLGVIARTSSTAYRGSGKTIAEIGRELSVSHVVEGSLRREGSRLRVTVQLVAAADQTPRWSETYDRTGADALDIQSEIAVQVARALALELRAVPTPSGRVGTKSLPARDALLEGRYFLNRGTPPDLRTALARIEDAVREDPSFAAAHAARAEAYHLHAMFGLMPSADAYARAREAAAEALRLDADLADAHAATGVVEMWANWNPQAAADRLARAVALNPSDASAHHDFAWALVGLRRFDEASAHIVRARELDPLSPRASNDIGWLFLHIRRPFEALRACRQTLALDPDSVEAQQCLERAHLQRGEPAEALAAAASASRRRGAVPAALEESGSPEERMHRLWRWRLERLRSAAVERYVSPYTLAMHHVVLGDDAEAMARLEEAYRERTGMMVLLASDPIFERLHDQPRFQQLVARIRP